MIKTTHSANPARASQTITHKATPYLPTVLTLAGSDGSGGAGLQADLKTISALHGYALSVPTALTAQNSRGVHSVYPLPARVIKAQLHAMFDDYQPDAVKLGMLANRQTIALIAKFLQRYPVAHVVVDPVLISSSGKALLDPTALDAFVAEILPLTTLLTPNLPEVNHLLKTANFKGQASEMLTIAKGFFALGVRNVVIKGGHSIEHDAIDYLVMASELSTNHLTNHPVQPPCDSHPQTTLGYHTFATRRLATPHTHGTGCTLASALATELAKGQPLLHAMANAKTFLFNGLQFAHQAQPRKRQELSNSLQSNAVSHPVNHPGHGGLHHFHDFFKPL
jgi:hydroxymethylpyrimidine/phosphomethylpyrimidine kinase